MSAETNAGLPAAQLESLANKTSELNNVLQIISGTCSLIEQACQKVEASAMHCATLRTTLERAEKLAAAIAQPLGGVGEKALTNPELAGLPLKNRFKPEKQHSILVVDDEPAALELVSRLLTEAGFAVTTAQSGFECLDHVRRHPFEFDLVLLDLTMPFMNGEETFDRLREVRPDLAVVMCTGFIQRDRLDRLMNVGLAGFLRKPLAPDEIVGHVRSTLARVKYGREQLDPNGVPLMV
jgi:CheY-like chemotaxis protein